MRFEENGLKIEGRVCAHGLRRGLLALVVLFAMCIPAFAQKNSGGQMYDRGAVVKSIKSGSKMSGYFVKVDAKKKIAYFYTDKKLTDEAGEYNLGEQFWIDWDAEKMDPLKVDLKPFYKKINLTKTILMRTQDGTPLANVKVIKAERPEKTEAQIQKEKDAAIKSGYDAGFVGARKSVPQSHADYSSEWYASYDEGAAESKRVAAEKSRQAAEAAKKDGYNAGLSGKSASVPKTYSAYASDWKAGYSEGAAEYKRQTEEAARVAAENARQAAEAAKKDGYNTGLSGKSESVPKTHSAYASDWKVGYSEGAAERKKLTDAAYKAGYDAGLKGSAKSPTVPSSYTAYSDSYKSGYTKGYNEQLKKKEEERIAKEKERERNAQQEAPSVSTGSSNSTASVQQPSTTSSYVPDAQVSENFVFTARKHPTVVSYDALDALVQKIKCATSMSIEDAAKKIVAPAKTEKEKARALFTWIACNVVYDYSFKKDSYTAAGTWKNRTGTCQGYTLLYIQMAKSVGLNAEYISGYAKNASDYKPGMELEKHGWGVVHINGKDVLFDVTWGAVKNLDDLSTFKGDYFDCDPWLFAFSHWTDESGKSFISDRLTKDRFIALPYVDIRFTRAGIDGKELYDFFKVNPNAWVPSVYNKLFEISALKINKMPFTNILLSSQTYTFNFSRSSEKNLIVTGYDGTNGNGSRVGMAVLLPNTDFVFKTSSTGLATINYDGFIAMQYNTEHTLLQNWSGDYFNKPNQSEVKFTLIDGGKDNNIAKGKPKVLCFFDSKNGSPFDMIIWQDRFTDAGIDVVMVEATGASRDNVKRFLQRAGVLAESVKYAYATDSSNSSLLNRYLTSAGIDASKAKLPMTVYLDSNNKYQFIEYTPTEDIIFHRVDSIATATKTVRPKINYFSRANFRKIMFTSIDGKKRISNEAEGKPKVIIFSHVWCEDNFAQSPARDTMQSLLDEAYAHPERFKDVDIVIVNVLGAKTKEHRDMVINYGNQHPFPDSLNINYAIETECNPDGTPKSYGTWGGYLNWYTAASGIHGSTSMSNDIVYIDSTNKMRWLDSGYGISADTILSRVADIEASVSKIKTSGANYNSYGLPYDKNAVINKANVGKQTNMGDYVVVQNSNDYIEFIGIYQAGMYDLKEQCWAYVDDEQLKNYPIDFSKYYTKIELSKTELNRDVNGNKIGSAPVANASVNSYGLPYDPNAKINTAMYNVPVEFGEYYMKALKDGDYVFVVRLRPTMENGGFQGVFDLKEQCWLENYPDLNRMSWEQLVDVDINIKQFYSSIDLTKTKLNRDTKGNPVCPR